MKSDFQNDPYVLITGGAGFIGTNLANRLATQGKKVVILDNLSRPGVEENLNWLLSSHPSTVSSVVEDVRDEKTVRALVSGAEAVFHLAAQVAVTTSLENPVADFEVNARGTLSVLEALRAVKAEGKPPVPLIYASTNKVMGGLEGIPLAERPERYEPQDEIIRSRGVSERLGIEFCSPYGCSKGAADQYVLDYARTFGIKGTVFRMSCIYGPHQQGTEDQGWVAHFVRRALRSETITFYGDGKQVRDILFVDDLVNAFLLAWKNIARVSGQAFNIGGGPGNTISLIELVKMIGEIQGSFPEVRRETWRPADQRYYVSDTRKFHQTTGWAPKVGVEEGIFLLHEWLTQAAGARVAS